MIGLYSRVWTHFRARGGTEISLNQTDFFERRGFP